MERARRTSSGNHALAKEGKQSRQNSAKQLHSPLPGHKDAFEHWAAWHDNRRMRIHAGGQELLAHVRASLHQTVLIILLLRASVGLCLLQTQVARSCRAMRPACLAVHLPSSTGSFIMSSHRPLSHVLAA